MAKSKNQKPLPAPPPAPKQAGKPVTAPKTNKPVKPANPYSFASILAVLAFLIYSNTFQNTYVLDDVMMVPENRIVAKGISALPEILTTPYLAGYMSLPNDNYRPLALITFTIETQIFGVNPVVNHTMNALIYGLCVFVLFFFLYHLLDKKNLAVAFIAALLFTVHPVHTEVVANIKSRDELLCFLFAISALVVFLKYIEKNKLFLLLAGGLCFFLSLLAKETSITFLGVAPLLFFTRYPGDKIKNFSITGLTVVSAVLFLLLRNYVLTLHHANHASFLYYIDNQLINSPIDVRVATAMMVLGQYIIQIIIPYPLLCSYGVNTIAPVGFSNFSAILSVIVYLGLVGYAIFLLTKDCRNLIAFCILFWIISLSVVSNLFFLLATIRADRFLFFPSVAFSLIAALLLEQVVRKFQPGAKELLKSGLLWVIVAPVCGIFIWMTINRNTEWRDNYTIALADVQKSPENARLNFYVGNVLSSDIAQQAPDPESRLNVIKDAIPYLQKAVAIYPGYELAQTTLGMAFLNLQMLDSAEFHHNQALKVDSMNSNALNGLAGIYFMKKEYAKAKDILLRDIKLNPYNPSIVFNLGNNYLNLHAFDSAEYYYRKALALNPNQIESLKGMAIAF